MFPTFFRHSLARELAVVITIKIVLIVVVAIFVFGPSHRPHVNAETVLHHLLAPLQG